MVRSKKKRQEDPYEALQRLMEEPGSPVDIWEDLYGSTRDAPLNRLERTLAGHPEYDDRAAALVFSALVEHSLELALSSCFVTDEKSIRRLFSYQTDGPLATFQAKISLGHALGLYDERMRKDLWRIKQIRNAFAHARVPVDFHTDAVARACQQLEASSRSAVMKTPRQKYTGAAGFLAMHLNGYSQPITTRARARLYETIYPSPASPQKP